MSDAWLQTYGGTQFYPLAARPEDVHITDIAHALSCTARYGGHTRRFYSVAQHSVLVSQVCKPEHALHGLLHDAAEAYLGDMPRPIKHAPGFEMFRQADHRLMLVIRERFGLTEWEPADVKHADAVLLATERRDLLNKLLANMKEKDWLHGAASAPPLSTTILAWPPDAAEHEFLARYRELTEVPAAFTGTPYNPHEEDGGW